MAQVGRSIGRSESHVSRTEAGSLWPSFDVLRRYAALYETDIDHLTGAEAPTAEGAAQ